MKASTEEWSEKKMLWNKGVYIENYGENSRKIPVRLHIMNTISNVLAQFSIMSLSHCYDKWGLINLFYESLVFTLFNRNASCCKDEMKFLQNQTRC